MAEIANAWITIVPDTSKIAPGIKKALASVDDAATSTGKKVGTKLASAITKTMKTTAATTGVAVGGVLAASITKGFGRLRSIDQARAKLTGLGNDAKTVASIMDNSLASVKGTAHGLEEAATTSAMMVAAGIAPGKELEQVLTTVGDSAAIAGIRMEDMGQIFGSVAARGKLQGDDMLQLTSRGIPVLQMLGEHLGKTSEEISEMVSKGQIDFATFEAAMRDGMGGAALEMGKTFSGSLANMGAAMARFGEAMIGPVFAGAPPVFNALGAAFDSMTAALKPATERIQAALTPAMEILAGVIETRLAPWLEVAAGAVGDVVALLVEKAVDPSTWQLLADIYQRMSEVAAIAWGPLSRLLDVIFQITSTISTKVWDALIQVIEALAPVLTDVVVPALETLAGFLKDHPELVGAMVTGWLAMKGINAVVSPLQGVARALMGVVKVFAIMKFADEMLKIAGAVGKTNPVLSSAARMAGRLANAFNPLGKVLKLILSPMRLLGKLLVTAMTRINPVVAVISAVAGALVWFFTKTETGQRVWQGFTATIEQAWQRISEAFAVGWQAVKSFFFDTFAAAVEEVKAAWQAVVGALTGAWGFIVEAFAVGWQAVVEFFVTAFEPIIIMFTEWWSALGEVVSAGWQIIKELFIAAGESIKEVIAAAWLVIVGLFTGNFSDIGTVVVNAWENIKGHFSRAGESITEIIAALVTGVVDRFNEMKARVGEILEGWKAAVSEKISSMWQAVKDLFVEAIVNLLFRCTTLYTSVVATFVRLREQVIAKVGEMKDRVVETYHEMMTRILDTVRELPGKIKGFFSDAGRWLVDAGRNIMTGLWDGLKSVWTSISSWLSGIRDRVTGVFSGITSTSRQRNTRHAEGSIVRFAHGGVTGNLARGISERHIAQIARPGDWRVWAEPETGGEAYIPLAPAKRARSTKILAVVAEQFGLALTGKDGHRLPATARGLVSTTGGFFAQGGIHDPRKLLAFAQGKNVDGFQARRSLDGDRYVFGGSNWGDCSGAQSMLAAVIVNAANPYARKFYTGDQRAWLSSHGFRQGLGSGPRYAVGFYNGGPGGGHTAGTIFFGDGSRINLEMGGAGANGKIGGAAAGADHPNMVERFFYPLSTTGGFNPDDLTIESTSVQGMTVSDSFQRAQIDWGQANALFGQVSTERQRREKLARFRAGAFDSGGLAYGKGFLVKDTIKPERVLSPSNTKAFDQLPGVLAQAVGAMNALTTRLSRTSTMPGFLGEVNAVLPRSVHDGLRGLLNQVSVGFEQVSRDSVEQFFTVGEKLGLGVYTSVFKGAVDSWWAVEDARIAQVDAADGLRKAEDNLIRAREHHQKVSAESGAGSEQAAQALAEVTRAEVELTDARATVAAAARAAGLAEIAMVIEVADLVMGLVDRLIGSIMTARVEAFKGMASMAGSVRELVGMAEKFRNEVTSLVVSFATSAIDLAAAERNVRIVRMDGAKASLEAAKTVAEAQAKFDAQRKADMRRAALDYTDLSLAYDRFRWNVLQSGKDSMNELAAWSNESHALYSELLAAQVGQQLAIKKAQEANLEATLKATLAALDLRDVTSSLGVAAQKLATMSGSAFGYDSVQATVGQRYANLVAEKASLQAEQASIKTWINPVNWFTAMPATQRRIKQIDAELANLAKRNDFKDFDASTKAAIDKAAVSAGFMGFFGAGDKVADMIKNSALGDAGRALDQIKFEHSVIDLKAEQDKLRSKIDRDLAELESRAKTDPLKTEIMGLERDKAANETWAEYWRADNAEVKKALADLAKVQADNALTLKTMAAESKTINLYGTTASMDDVEKMLGDLGYRVNRLENPRPSALDVVGNRR